MYVHTHTWLSLHAPSPRSSLTPCSPRCWYLDMQAPNLQPRCSCGPSSCPKYLQVFLHDPKEGHVHALQGSHIILCFSSELCCCWSSRLPRDILPQRWFSGDIVLPTATRKMLDMGAPERHSSFRRGLPRC